MDRKFFHGAIKPIDIARALIAEFDQGNLRAQMVGQNDNIIVQVNTNPGASSGGQTALTITLQSHQDGVMIEVGQQAWLGVAASLGVSALSALRNPFSLLGRLDDIAQDIENLQLTEKVWLVVTKSVKSLGASQELSDRLKRLTCEFCHTANPVGEPSCISCGAPLGHSQPTTCHQCGFIIQKTDKNCPNCKAIL